MGEALKEERVAAARSRAAADAKAKADDLAKKKAESAAAAKLKAERKAYAAREASEKADRCARALVVEKFGDRHWLEPRRYNRHLGCVYAQIENAYVHHQQ